MSTDKIGGQILMKYYFLEGCTRDGEFEYNQKMVLVNISSLTRKQAEKRYIGWFGFPKGNYQVTQLHSFKEITIEDYIVLKKYL